MSTVIGKKAESVACEFLEAEAFTVLDRNWRTKWCEIDVVAQKEQCIYFIEVKFRKNSQWGAGVEYITSQKLRQMVFAADMWVAHHQWKGDYKLSAMSITGQKCEIDYWVDDVSR